MRRFVPVLLAVTVGCGQGVAESAATTASTRQAMLQKGIMKVYSPGQPVPQEELMDLGDPASLGGEVLQGDPHISARVDFAQNGMMAGIFQATRGRVRITFPFTEHATILFGNVTLTDEAGNRHTYTPGDSYLIKQGSVVLWEVDGPYVQKSFFNIVEQE